MEKVGYVPTSTWALALGELSGTDIGELKADSFDLFDALIHREGKDTDYRLTQLAFWRFGSSGSVGDLGLFWGLLPADSRVPDHTIWSHVDLTSAFAGSFAADIQSTPALLSASQGPVQPFIAQARTTSDLWAGSHLLSRLAWEAIKVVAERFGPGAVLFPQLRASTRAPRISWSTDKEYGATDMRPGSTPATGTRLRWCPLPMHSSVQIWTYI